MPQSTDRVVCTVSTEDMHGDNKSASITMDLDSPRNSCQESELLVYQTPNGYTAVNSGNDCPDAWNPGSYVGSLSVTTIIDDGQCLEVRVLVRYINHSKEISMSKNLDVCAFKEKIYKELFQVVPSQQRLIHKGKTLADGQTIASYNFCNGDTVDLTTRLRGG